MNVFECSEYNFSDQTRKHLEHIRAGEVDVRALILLADIVVEANCWGEGDEERQVEKKFTFWQRGLGGSETQTQRNIDNLKD